MRAPSDDLRHGPGGLTADLAPRDGHRPPESADLRVFLRKGAPDDRGFSDRWNLFVGEAEDGHLQQSYEFGALKRALGWKTAFVWVERQSRILAGALVLLRTLPGGLLAVAHVPRGPVWLPEHMGLVPGVLAELSTYCQRNRTIFCRVYPSCEPQKWDAILTQIQHPIRVSRSYWSYWNQARTGMVVDLTGDVMARISPDTRTKIRRGPKRGLEVKRCGSEAVPDLARLIAKMADRKRLRVRDEAYFRSLFGVYPADRIAIFSAVAEGRTTAAALVVLLSTTAYYLYGAFEYASRKLYPTEAIQHAIMEWAKQQGCRRYDMGGTCTDWPITESDRGYGVYQFKKQLGAEVHLSAPYVDLVFRPWLYGPAFATENLGIPLVLERGMDKLRIARKRFRENL